MIRETKVQPYQIDQICDRCGDGMYRISGRPVLYPHDHTKNKEENE